MIFLTEVSFVNVDPDNVVSGNVYVNVISLAVDVTVKVPLYPRLSDPKVFSLSFTFLMLTVSPS